MLTPGAPGRTVDARPPGALSSTTVATHHTLSDYSHSPCRERLHRDSKERKDLLQHLNSAFRYSIGRAENDRTAIPQREEEEKQGNEPTIRGAEKD